MNSDSVVNYFELLMLGTFVGGWMLLEWQGRRLDRKREADKARRDAESSKAPTKK